MIHATRAQTRWLASMCTEATLLAIDDALTDLRGVDAAAGEQLRQRLSTALPFAIGDVVDKIGSPSVVLQRIEHLECGTVIGYEAFARFGGGTGPVENFRRASELGLAVDLEIVTLQAALARLDEIPIGAFLAVNVSADALFDGRVIALLSETDATRLVVELTQQSSITEIQELLRRFDALQAIGAVIAIDGAGVGVFRGNRLLELRPEMIKVDRTLVSDCDTSADQRTQLAKLIKIGRRIGATVVATGVERLEERDVLSSLGFDAVQGYFVGEPVVDLVEDARSPLMATY